MSRKWITRMDTENRLVIPRELTDQFMLNAGQELEIEIRDGNWLIRRPVSQLARVYVEPTNLCNLDCRTCMRNVWDEPLGRMNLTVEERLFSQLEKIHPIPEVFFGGYGEPLAHPRIVAMVRRAKQLKARVELITNGTLLDEPMLSALMDAGLDYLWVSLDGARPESYADVRLGAKLGEVLGHLRKLGEMKRVTGRLLPELGIAFVAMRRNIRDLPEMARLAKELGATRLSVSHVLAHHAGLRREALYERMMAAPRPELLVSMPDMDGDPDVIAARLALESEHGVAFADGTMNSGDEMQCPFIQKGSLSVRWDGAVSPCLPLLHSHPNYLGGRTRRNTAYTCGDVRTGELWTIWNEPAYVDLRRRIQSSDFSPCVFCNTCEMSEENLEDCFGNRQPACGGCLWAQRLIQCP